MKPKSRNHTLINYLLLIGIPAAVLLVLAAYGLAF